MIGHWRFRTRRVSAVLAAGVVLSIPMRAQQSSLAPRAVRASADAEQMRQMARDLAEATRGFEDADPHTLTELRVLQGRLASARTAIEDGRVLVRERRTALRRATDRLDAMSRDLQTVRNPRSSNDDVLAACERLYPEDPRVFNYNSVTNCRTMYRGAYSEEQGARRAVETAQRDTIGVGELSEAAEKANAAARTLEGKLDGAERSLDDDLRGKQAYRWALGFSAGTSVALLALLVFGNPEVRRTVFREVRATELVTVLAIVMAVIFFGAIRTLNGEAVAGLLGGISGYVLGRQRERPPEPGSPSPLAPAPTPSPGSGTGSGA